MEDKKVQPSSNRGRDAALCKSLIFPANGSKGTDNFYIQNFEESETLSPADFAVETSHAIRSGKSKEEIEDLIQQILKKDVDIQEDLELQEPIVKTAVKIEKPIRKSINKVKKETEAKSTERKPESEETLKRKKKVIKSSEEENAKDVENSISAIREKSPKLSKTEEKNVESEDSDSEDSSEDESSEEEWSEENSSEEEYNSDEVNNESDEEEELKKEKGTIKSPEIEGKDVKNLKSVSRTRGKSQELSTNEVKKSVSFEEGAVEDKDSDWEDSSEEEYDSDEVDVNNIEPSKKVPKETEDTVVPLPSSNLTEEDWALGVNYYDLEDLAKLVKESYEITDLYDTSKPLVNYDNDELYKTMLEIVNKTNYTGEACDKEEVLKYLDEVFNKENAYCVAETVDPNKRTLKVVINEAAVLQSKYIKSSKHVFCILYLKSNERKWYITDYNRKYVKNNISKKIKLSEKKSEKPSKRAKAHAKIKKVQPGNQAKVDKYSLKNPVWEEYNTINDIDPESDDSLIVKVMFSEIEDSPLEALKAHNVEKLQVFLKKCHIVGECEVPIQSIQLGKVTVGNYSLTKKTIMSTKARGLMNLEFHYMKLMKSAEALDKYKQLVYTLIAHRQSKIEKTENRSRSWRNDWDKEATMLIKLCIFDLALSPISVNLGNILAYAQLHQKYPVCFHVLYNILLKYLKIIQDNSELPSGQNSKSICLAIKIVLHSAFFVLGELRRMKFQGKAAYHEIEAIFKIVGVATSKPINAMMGQSIFLPRTKEILFPIEEDNEWRTLIKIQDPPKKERISKLLQRLIEKTGKAWFNELVGPERSADEVKGKPEFEIEQQDLEHYTHIVDKIKAELKNLKTVTGYIEKYVNLTYTDVLYKVYYNLIKEQFSSRISDISDKVTKYVDKKCYSPLVKALFPLFSSMKEFYAEKEKEYNRSDPHNLSNDVIIPFEFRKWFSTAIYYHFQNVPRRLVSKVDEKIKTETFQILHQKRCTCFNTYMELCDTEMKAWRDLGYVKKDVSSHLISNFNWSLMKLHDHFIDSLVKAALVYSKKDKNEGMTLNSPNFNEETVNVFSCWITVVNTIAEIVNHLTESSSGANQLIIYNGNELSKDISKKVTSIEERLNDLLIDLVLTMESSVTSFFTKMVQSTTYNEEFDAATSGLTSYVKNVLEELKSRLKFGNYEKVSHYLNVLIITHLRNNLVTGPSNSNFYSTFRSGYKTFVNDLNLLSDEKLASDLMEVEELFKWNLAKTVDIIKEYKERRHMEPFNKRVPMHGYMYLKSYIKDNALHLNIERIDNLQALDIKEGFSKKLALWAKEKKMSKLSGFFKYLRGKVYLDVYVLSESFDEDANSKSLRKCKSKRHRYRRVCVCFYERMKINLSEDQLNSPETKLNFEIRYKTLFGSKYVSETFVPLKKISNGEVTHDTNSMFYLSRPKPNFLYDILKKRNDYASKAFVSHLQSALEWKVDCPDRKHKVRDMFNKRRKNKQYLNYIVSDTSA